MPEWKGRVPLTRSHCERITACRRSARRPAAGGGALPTSTMATVSQFSFDDSTHYEKFGFSGASTPTVDSPRV
ncbi:hypothetical protein EVAR_93979_1 [Eumeta japonica]|uniref:Uncharacterized protein n=1 Tax=Eumeta variegata TaxID=151549 RepID=A0A4C1TPB4_EUMVA|nr:hypothetical protein EVAR_93979_1 [Eumeta japonica]